MGSSSASAARGEPRRRPVLAVDTIGFPAFGALWPANLTNILPLLRIIEDYRLLSLANAVYAY